MVNRVFLGWSEPIVDMVAEWLLARREADPGLCVVVPTMQSGRRLRERMTEKSKGIRAPEMITPAAFLQSNPPEVSPAWLEITAWCEVLENVRNWGDYEGLFPTPPVCVPGDVHDLAGELQKLATRLQDNGHTFASAARILGTSCDGSRWACLAKLEGLFRSTLKNRGFASRSDALARRDATALTHREYVLAGISDLPRLVSRMFQTTDKPVTVLIGAPSEHADDFDAVGCPLPAWNRIPMPWPLEGRGGIHLMADTRAQAREALRQVAAHESAPHEVALGAADTDLARELARLFTENGWTAFDPAGDSTHTGLRRWLRAWLSWLHDESFDSLQNLLALPESGFLADAEKRVACLRVLNRLRDKEMLSEVRHLYRFKSSGSDELRTLAEVTEAALQERHNFLSQPYGKSMSQLTERLETHSQASELESLLEWVDAAASFNVAMDRTPVFWLEMMLESLPCPPPSPSPDRMIDVLGWLELAFSKAPHLVFCGMNDGKVPSHVEGDPWLGQHACGLLGLPTNESRAARDAYLTRYLTECRRQNGRVDWICGKTNAGGDTLLPSRILLRAEADELARRVKHLFREIPPTDSGLRWHADWTWQTPNNAHGESVRVTAFKDWLQCPFRYYLRHVVGMQTPEPDRIEWNARDYGTIFHQIVEWWGQDEDARDFSKTESLSKWFSSRLDKLVFQRFGKSPTLAVRLQTESLRQRLDWFAREQAVLRASGWRTIDVERKFELPLGSWTVRGMIDRIDEHPESGQRVIDYKTSSDLGKVSAEHLSKVTTNTRMLKHWEDNSPVFFTTEDGKGKPQTLRWTNLQLPLYAAAIQQRTGMMPTPCYIGIGTSRERVKVDPWDDFSEKHLGAAIHCAEWVLGRIRDRSFWPPAENSPYPEDDASALACGRPVAEMFHPV